LFAAEEREVSLYHFENIACFWVVVFINGCAGNKHNGVTAACFPHIIRRSQVFADTRRKHFATPSSTNGRHPAFTASTVFFW
jgi:hypothetical protein